MEEALRGDLEQCRSAIASSDQAAALAALERAFGKLDSALDIVRSHAGRSTE